MPDECRGGFVVDAREQGHLEDQIAQELARHGREGDGNEGRGDKDDGTRSIGIRALEQAPVHKGAIAQIGVAAFGRGFF